MAESRFVSAARLKVLVAYCAAAFVALLLLGGLLPPGTVRAAAVAAWIVAFPLGVWRVVRRR